MLIRSIAHSRNYLAINFLGLISILGIISILRLSNIPRLRNIMSLISISPAMPRKKHSNHRTLKLPPNRNPMYNSPQIQEVAQPLRSPRRAEISTLISKSIPRQNSLPVPNRPQQPNPTKRQGKDSKDENFANLRFQRIPLVEDSLPGCH